jgi:Tol biopolymer transport system component
MNADGTGVKRLTDDPGDDLLPAWSPDGTKIAFVRGVGTNPDIYVMNADGTGASQLTNDPAEDLDPSWSL